MSKSISRVVSAVALTAMLASPMASASNSDTVILGGTVTSTLAIAATDTAAASALPLDGSAAGAPQIVKVADMAISTNNEQGFTLSASSGNLTKLGGTSIAFQVDTVVDGASAPVAGDFLVASGSADTAFQSSGAGSQDGDLYILYTPATLQDPGDYAGSISLTVSDN